MWDLPGPGLEPVSPALVGGFLTTVPPGKPLMGFLKTYPLIIKVKFYCLMVREYSLYDVDFFFFWNLLGPPLWPRR